MNKKPILSDQDKRKVLSAKKKQKVVLKNLLVQPFERNWPELTPSDAEHFAQKFRRLYKASSTDNANESTNSAGKHQNVQTNKDFANKVMLGLRSAIRCVSSGKTVALFISSKIRPKYIVDQIIITTITKNANSKVFCVPDLDVALEDQNDLWHWSMQKSKQFPLPKSYEKSKIPSVTERMDVESTIAPPVVLSEVNDFDVSTLHLRKENANQRAFVPHGTKRKNDKANDFILLGETNVKIVNNRPKHQLISTTTQKTDKPFVKRNALSEQISMKREKMITTHNQHFHSNKGKGNYLP